MGVIEKMYKRYGVFRITDYRNQCFELIAIGTALAIYVMCMLVLPLDRMLLICLLPAVIRVIATAYFIWNSSRECFDIVDDTIIVQKGKMKYLKKIPEELTLIISYADVCESGYVIPMGMPEKWMPYAMEGKYGLSIFKSMDMKEVIKRVHSHDIGRDTMNTIKAAFEEHQFIYSFVYEEALLKEIARNRKVNLLMPKSLLDEVQINLQIGTIYIDPKR